MAKKTKKIDLKNAALIVVDVQNDFCPGGSLAVNHGNEVVVPLNTMICLFNDNELPIFATRDWHPADTKHFKDFGGIWPPHCVQHTFGACFHNDLRFIGAEIITKGISAEEDEESYSGFGGVNYAGRKLGELLETIDVTDLYIGGLATDYCVKRTVLDGLKRGFKVYLLEDACRAVNLKPTDGADAIKEIIEAGKKAGRGKFKITTTKEVLGK